MRRTLPFSWYHDPEVLARERDRIFARHWQYAGHAGLVPGPGTVAAVEVAFRSVILVRDQDGTLRGFLNVCRHRGARLVEQAAERSTIQCVYHAWTWQLDGRLRAAPRSGLEDDFDPDAFGLIPLAVDRWGPFLFVNPDTEAPPLPEALGDVPERVAELMDVDELRYHSTARSSYRADWKICCENFLECYHCQVAHPGFVAVVDTSEDAYRLEEGPLHSSQYGPVKDDAEGLDRAGPIPRGQFHFLFPNTTVNIMPGRTNLSIGPIIPTGPGRTDRRLDYFFGPDADEAWIAELLAWDDRVGAEDTALVERVQRGVESAAGLEDGFLFRAERLIAHFDGWLRRELEGP